MEWAKNHLGELIAASETGVLRWGLTCPSCREPVKRRAGPERRPHFAHFSNRAKPDCESYFPNKAHVGSIAGARGQIAVERIRPIQAGLFLSRDMERRNFELLLRIPGVPFNGGDGSIEIQTGVGSRTYSTAQLNKSRIIPLRPTFTPVSCIGSGLLASLAIFLNALAAEFGDWLNFFHRGQEGGRLLGRTEPLEWGRKYLVLSPNQLEAPEGAAYAFALEAHGRLSSWYVYEIALAEENTSNRRDATKILASFLGRVIATSRPKVYLLHPLPHHVDVDGTIIFSHWPKTLIVRSTTEDTIGLVTCSDTNTSYTTQVSNDGFICLEHSSIPGDEVVLTIAGRDQFIIRVEKSGLMEPKGLVATVGEKSWDVASYRQYSSEPENENAVSVECLTARLATHLARCNSGWSINGTTLISGASFSGFFGANFGDIRFESKREDFLGALADQPNNESNLDLKQNKRLFRSLSRQLCAEDFARFNLYANDSGIPTQVLLRAQGGKRLIPYIKPRLKY